MKVLLLFLVVALTACNREPPPEPVNQAIRPAKLFRVAAVENTTRHSFVGKVEAAQTVDMSFQVPGRLAKLDILEGQQLPRGTLIAALEPDDYDLAVREARVQLNIARQDFDRKKSLLKDKGISESLVDDARALYQLRQVHLAQARENLADTKMLAPFDNAYVSKRFVDNHVNVTGGQPIVRLYDMNTLHIVTSVPEAMRATATNDQVRDLYTTFSFLPGERFPLTVRETSGEGGNVAQTYEVTLIPCSAASM